MADATRIDKWLWTVRVYKTRSIATEECKKGRITIGGMDVKPSRDIKIGDILEVRKPPITYRYKVLQFPANRLGAKLVPEYMQDITPPENLKVLEMQKYMGWSERDRGTGRPTKKERREIDRLQDFEED
jgi:ribosome-associated heat shock protein Hsp15